MLIRSQPPATSQVRPEETDAMQYDSPIHILLVEDNPGDALLLREALAAEKQSRHLAREV